MSCFSDGSVPTRPPAAAATAASVADTGDAKVTDEASTAASGVRYGFGVGCCHRKWDFIFRFLFVGGLYLLFRRKYAIVCAELKNN
jgi:hypothetical protein